MSDVSMNLKKRNAEMKNIFLFLWGKTVSMLGTSVYGFAISLYVLSITGSALNYAITIMINILPLIIISPIAGVFADRLPKKLFIIGMDLANGLLFLFLFYISRYESLSLVQIYVSSFFLSVFTSFYDISMEAAKPNITYPESRIKVNSLSKLIDSASAILGPILGGVMIALVDIRLFILMNGISFVMSALSEGFINYEFYLENNRREDDDKKMFVQHVKEGIHYIYASSLLKEAFLLFLILNFLLGFSMNVPLPYIVNEILLLPSKLYGIINAMISIGLIVGALTVEKLMRRISYMTILAYTMVAIAVLVSLLGLPVVLQTYMNEQMHTIYFSIICLLIGMGISYVDIPIITIMQNEIPWHIRGVVFGVSMSTVKLVLPMALLLSGALVSYIPITVLPIIGAIVTLVIFFGFRRRKEDAISVD